MAFFQETEHLNINILKKDRTGDVLSIFVEYQDINCKHQASYTVYKNNDIFEKPQYVYSYQFWLKVLNEHKLNKAIDMIKEEYDFQVHVTDETKKKKVKSTKAQLKILF